MREEQLELMKEYLTEIDTSTNTGNREETLFKIIQTEKRTIPDLINNVLTIVLIIIVLSAVIHGRYIANTVKIYRECNGELTPYNETIPANWMKPTIDLTWQNKTNSTG